MLDHQLRRAKDRVLAPVAELLRGVPPMTITAVGLTAGLGCAAAAFGGETSLALGLWAANRTLDGLDGTVARFAGSSSDRGGYFDLVADFITYAAIPVAQVAGAPDPGAIAVPLGALLGAYYVNAVSWLALSAILERRARDVPTDHAGASRSRAGMAIPEHQSALTGDQEPGKRTVIFMPAGLVEGTETVIFVAVCLAWPAGLHLLFSSFAALVMVTALQRAAWAWRALCPD